MALTFLRRIYGLSCASEGLQSSCCLLEQQQWGQRIDQTGLLLASTAGSDMDR